MKSAWTLNLRGSDVECNPVFYGYLLFGPDGGTLFTHGEDMDPALASALQDDRIDLAPYSDIFDALKDAKGSVASDPGTLNVAAAGKLDDRLRSVASPVKLWKAVKTGSELASTRRVMERDGVAMVKLLHWIEKSAASGDSLDELTISNKITELRSAGKLLRRRQFPLHRSDSRVTAPSSIIGSIAKAVSAVEGNGLLLIDSGGQYADGTTDITRTLAVGNPSPEQIDQFHPGAQGQYRPFLGGLSPGHHRPAARYPGPAASLEPGSQLWPRHRARRRLRPQCP
jgi:Xaa-Pro aminopeptidase